VFLSYDHEDVAQRTPRSAWRIKSEVMGSTHGSILQATATAVRSAITGLGGMGKTRLTLEHVFLGERDDEARWRVRASEVAGLQEDSVTLGQ